MERARGRGRILIALAIAASGACASAVHFERPRVLPSHDPEAQPDPKTLQGPGELYTIEPLLADVDEVLRTRVERVDHAGCVLDVFVGEAILLAFRQDASSRVRIRFGESRFDPELHFGGFFDANSEVTYTLYVTVSLDGGPDQSVVASGRSASSTALDSVSRAVAICVRDLHAKVNNLLRAEARSAAPPTGSRP